MQNSYEMCVEKKSFSLNAVKVDVGQKGRDNNSLRLGVECLTCTTLYIY